MNAAAQQAMPADPFAVTPSDLRGGGAHLAAALNCAARGWKVFPIQPGKKIPFGDADYERHGEPKPVVDGEEKGGVWRATSDPMRIRTWWTRWKGAGIGLLCGPAPECSGVWVLDADIDREKGKDGFRTLGEYAARGFELPATCGQDTGGGGRQWIFAWPEGVAGDELKNSVQKLGGGLDVRVRGGYVVLPPSRHPSGRTYAWRLNEDPETLPPAAAPEWLVERLKRSAEEGAQDPAGDAPNRPSQERAYDTRGVLPYLARALDDACAAIAGARPGNQHPVLRGEAFGIGGLIREGAGQPWGLSEEYAANRLIAAGMSMACDAKKGKWTYKQVESTVRSGLRRGQTDSKRTIPEDALPGARSSRGAGPVPAARDERPAPAPAMAGTPAPAAGGSGHPDLDRAAATAIWDDCLPLAKGPAQGRAYLARFGAEDLPARLRVGILPWRHVGADGRVHDLGRHPCLVGAYGPRGAKGILRVWLNEDGSDQARVEDPDNPGRALPAHQTIGETDGLAIQLGAASEGLTVAVTLECALSILGEAPGSVWVVDGLAAAGRLDLPDGLAKGYLALWKVPRSPTAREKEIARVGWHLSAGNQRRLERVNVPMLRGWSPLPGRPAVLVERERAEADGTPELMQWADDGGRL